MEQDKCQCRQQPAVSVETSSNGSQHLGERLNFLTGNLTALPVPQNWFGELVQNHTSPPRSSQTQGGRLSEESWVPDSTQTPLSLSLSHQDVFALNS